MDMQAEYHLRSGLHQPPGPVLENIGILRLDYGRATIRINQARPDVVNDAAALGRLDFDSLDISVLRKAGVNDDVLPHIWTFALDDNVLRHRRNKFRRTD